MRRFIKKTLYISLPIFVIAITAEVLLRNIPNDYSYKKGYLDTHSSEIETLILGSSHSFYGLNPDFFSTKAFNAAHLTQTLDYDFEIFKKYRSNLNHLKTIVLPVSYAGLWGRLGENTPWRIKNYTIYYEMNTSNSIIHYSEVLSSRVKINSERLTSYYILGKLSRSCTPLGWGTEYKSENALDLVKTGISSAVRHSKNINSIQSKKKFKESKLILDSIASWCKNKNVRLILFTAPTFKTYYQNLDEEQLNKTIETIKKIDLEYDNCIYFNLLKDTNFVAEDFFDAHHLSELGAEKLSKIINNKINNWE